MLHISSFIFCFTILKHEHDAPQRICQYKIQKIIFSAARSRIIKFMYRLRLLAIVLRPSFFSFIAIALVTLFALSFSVWPYAMSQPLLYDYFWGPHGIVT